MKTVYECTAAAMVIALSACSAEVAVDEDGGAVAVEIQQQEVKFDLPEEREIDALAGRQIFMEARHDNRMFVTADRDASWMDGCKMTAGMKKKDECREHRFSVFTEQSTFEIIECEDGKDKIDGPAWDAVQCVGRLRVPSGSQMATVVFFRGEPEGGWSAQYVNSGEFKYN